MLINDARERTFYARIFLRMENELGKKFVEIDARPSDSIVLALQQQRPIYVVRAVFERIEDSTDVLEREAEAGRRRRATRRKPRATNRCELLPPPILPGQPLRRRSRRCRM